MDKKFKKRLMMILLILAGACLLAAGGWLFYFKSQFAVYKDKTFQFSVKYPIQWKVIPQPSLGIAVVFQSPKGNPMDVFQENINVGVQDVPGHLSSLGTFSRTITKQMTVVFKSNIKISEDKDIRLANRPGHRMVFETPPPESFKVIIDWTLKGSKAYILSFMGRIDQYEGLKYHIDEVFHSFVLE